MFSQLLSATPFLAILLFPTISHSDQPASASGEANKSRVKPPLIGESDDSPAPNLKRELQETKAPTKSELPAPANDDTNRPYEVIAVAPSETNRPSGGKVGVGFFNHSDRDIVLEIGGQVVKLDSLYYVQIKLPREFSWREREGIVQKTKVPANADGVEIVFRR